MDFITGLPKVLGKDCIFVVVDKITKFAHLFVFTTTFTATQVAELFFKEVFILHGLPKNNVSDRNNRFLSEFWQELIQMVGSNLTPITRYNPKTYGQKERVNQWLEG